MPRKAFLVGYLVFAMLVATGWAWNQAPASATPAATGRAVFQTVKQRVSHGKCDGIPEYTKEIAKVFNTPEGRWFMNDFGDSTPDDWTLMSPDELAKTERNLRLLASDLENVDPPTAAKDFHEDLIRFMRLYANIFHTAQESWTAVAMSGYGDVAQQLGERFVKESDALQKLCGKDATGSLG
jgi:hypothetical protein